MDRDAVRSVKRVLGGDPTAMSEISGVDHASLRTTAETIGQPLIVTRVATVGVLRGLIDNRFPPRATQAWASFLRRGYIEGSARGPIDPIHIEFEEPWEGAISAAISRMDEIGDVIDGAVANGEALDLLQLLGEP